MPSYVWVKDLSLDRTLLFSRCVNFSPGKIKLTALQGHMVHSWRIIWCLCVSGIQRQIFKHLKFFSERSTRIKKTKKGIFNDARSAHNSQNTQFGLVMGLSLVCLYLSTWLPHQGVFCNVTIFYRICKCF